MAGAGERALTLVTSRWALVGWFVVLSLGLTVAYLRRFEDAATDERVLSLGLAGCAGAALIIAQLCPPLRSSRVFAGGGAVAGAGFGTAQGYLPAGLQMAALGMGAVVAALVAGYIALFIHDDHGRE